MESKLTLKLDKDIINLAKQYAKEHNISLSKMIESYLQSITSNKKEPTEVSPLVSSLTGVIHLDDDHDEYRKGYTDFLNKKYS